MASNTAPDLGPLDWRISITDKAGRPTPEFQRRWATQRGNNDLIRTITTGNGSPVDPPKSDGDEYIDINATPPILYVGSAGTWVVVGVTEFTQLSDVPHDYTAQGSKLVQVKPDVTGLQFNSLSSVLDTISTVRGTVLYRGASGWSGLGPGTSGYVLTTEGASADPVWATVSAGTVSSVGLSAPTIFTVSGSPVTTSGTLTFSLNTQTANKVLSGPTTGAAATPTFRALVAADIPALSYAPVTSGSSILYGNGTGGFSSVTIGTGLTFSGGTLSAAGGSGTVTSVAITAPAIFTVGGSPITSSGTLTLTLATQSANLVWAGPTTGSAATPTFRALVAADIPSLSYAPQTSGTSLLYGNGTGGFSNVTIGSGVTFSGGTLSATGTGTVTSSGPPTTGSIASFSSATNIVTGNLSGDVTTSGSLATTVAKIAGTTVSGTSGSGNVIFSTSPVLITPSLGTPTALIGTNITGTGASFTAGNATKLTTGRTISITGDLAYTSPSFNGSGDVTAAGTLANTAVSPGAYTLANITVDSKGRITSAANGGATTSPLGMFAGIMSAVPSQSGTGFTTWLNQGTTTATDTSIGINFTGLGSGQNHQVRGLYQAVPGTPYTKTIMFIPGSGKAPPNNVSAFCWLLFGWYDGTNKLHVLGNWGTSSFQELKYNTPSSANTATTTTLGASPWMFLRIQDDGTNIKFFNSVDGVIFNQINSVAKSAGFLGASGYSNIFLGIDDYSTPYGWTVLSYQ